MRGEQITLPYSSAQKDGSSPHAWGTVIEAVKWGDDTRFIPTCVGNRAKFIPITGKMTVHPHMRGEQFRILQKKLIARGSSPHAWGTE